MLHLSSKWAESLLSQAETGIGYVVCTVGLKDGRTFERVVIDGGVITQVGRDRVIPFDECEIEWIKATHDKSML